MSWCDVESLGSMKADGEDVSQEVIPEEGSTGKMKRSKKLSSLNRSGVRARVELQPRDLEVLLFVNEMGPVDGTLLGLRHFANDPSELTSARIRTAKERLTELAAGGYLARHRLGHSGRNYFRTTPLGVRKLASAFPDLKQLTAIANIALGTFDHHQRVAWSRVALEKMGAISGWRSERRLISSDRELQRVRLYQKMAPYVPDGVYLEAASGRRVMFELELAAKTDRQMAKRVQDLLGLLTYLPERYQGVHFVCSTQAIRERVERLIAPYQTWKAQTYSDLLSTAGIWSIYEE